MPSGVVGVKHRQAQELECCKPCVGSPQLGFIIGSALAMLWKKFLAEYLGMQT